MPDVQPKQNPREIEMERLAQSRREEFTRETGITIHTEPLQHSVVADPDADPDDAAAEAERKRLADVAAGRATDHSGESAEDMQLRLQREQEAGEAAERERAEAAAAAEARDATSKASTSSLDPAAKIKLKVNGRDVEITGEEALRRLQKDTSADQRLEEATRLMRDAQDLQRSLQQAPAQPAKKDDEVVIDPASAKEFTSALFAGDEEKATQAFNKAVSSAVKAATAESRGRGDATPVDPNVIAAQVRQQIDIDSALDRSRTSYPELYADPDIEYLGATKVTRLVKAGTPFSEALATVETEMASKFGWKKRAAGTPTPPRDNRREDKLARKESLDQTPSGPNVTKATTTEPVADVHSVIEQMRRDRDPTYAKAKA